MRLFKKIFRNNSKDLNVTSDSHWVEYNGPIRDKHAIFDKFNGFSGLVPNFFEVDYIGTLTNYDLFTADLFTADYIGTLTNYNLFTTDQANRQKDNIPITISMPIIEEDYFEWIDLLSSVYNAGDDYTMIELGAGYGRWAVRSAFAARQRNIKKIHIGLVEAEPVHAAWLKSHLINNHIQSEEATVYECAVSDKDGQMLFSVGMPDRFNEKTPGEWYGQALIHSHDQAIFDNTSQNKLKTSVNTMYQGRPVIDLSSGYKAINVEVRDICRILSDFKEIDLLDLDVQGEESKVLTRAKDMLCKQVKRVHVGTHSNDIEKDLRILFKKMGWLCLQDYRCGYKEKTPFGEVAFQDGVQTWINPKFEHTILF